MCTHTCTRAHTDLMFFLLAFETNGGHNHSLALRSHRKSAVPYFSPAAFRGTLHPEIAHAVQEWRWKVLEQQ